MAARPLIVIDPGHGGHDPGALARNVAEKDIALVAAFMLSDELFSEHGFETMLTRTSDLFVHLGERAHLANTLNARAFISLHCNAYREDQAHGFEVWTSHGYTEADPWAAEILSQVAQAFPDLTIRQEKSASGPDKEAGFTVLTRTLMPPVLVEMGFLTNDEDRARLVNRDWLRRLMRTVAFATAKWYEEEMGGQDDE